MRRRLLMTLLAALACVVLPAGCVSKNQSADLSANPWVATQILTASGLSDVLIGTSPAIYFRPDGALIGNATVNTFGGTYTLDGGSINAKPLVSAAWEGSSLAESQQETFFMDALTSASSYRVNAGILELKNGANQVVMSLKVAQEPKLVGPLWRCTDLVSEKGELASVVGTNPVGAEFAPDGLLDGSAGVNQYSTTYKAQGSQMTIGPEIAVTKKAGPEPIMAQEARYIDALVRTRSFTIEGYRLTLLDGTGKSLAVYVPWATKE